MKKLRQEVQKQNKQGSRQSKYRARVALRYTFHDLLTVICQLELFSFESTEAHIRLKLKRKYHEEYFKPQNYITVCGLHFVTCSEYTIVYFYPLTKSSISLECPTCKYEADNPSSPLHTNNAIPTLHKINHPSLQLEFTIYDSRELQEAVKPCNE